MAFILPMPATTISFFKHDYKVLQVLGVGGNSTVYSATDVHTGQQKVIKCIPKFKIKQASWSLDRFGSPTTVEALIGTLVKHPHIQEIEKVVFDNEYLCLFSSLNENCTYRDLFDYINRRDRVEMHDCAYIFKQIVSAIMYLFSLNILQRDIKDENVLIDNDLSIKLIDFGSAQIADMSKPVLNCDFAGTLQYAAPEIHTQQWYDGPKSEVWALGCLLKLLATGTLAFSDLQQLLDIEPVQLDPALSSSLRSLLNAMLEKDCRKRCTLTDVPRISNDWFGTCNMAY